MKFSVLHIISLFFTCFVQAQVLSNLLIKADSLQAKTNLFLNFPDQTTLNTNLFAFHTLSKINVNKYEVKLKELEAEQFKQDIGLVFKATTNYNFKNAFDEEENSLNKFRIRTELEWNILKNGFIHNKIKAKQKENEIAHLNQKKDSYKKYYWRRQFRINYSFIANKESIKLTELFINFENEYFDILNQLYSQKHIKREELIKVGNQIYVLKNQLKILKQKNNILKDSVSKKIKLINELPIYYINPLVIKIEENNNNQTFLKNNIKLQHKAVNDLNLSIYVNQNYNYSITNSQYFSAIGIRFKAPLRFNKRNKIIKTKQQLLAAKQHDFNLGKRNKLITHINLYNEKLKDLQNEYTKWQVVNERIRVLQLLKQELNSYKTGIIILNLTEEKFKIIQNLIQIKKQLYTTISHLFELHPNNNIKDILIPYSFDKSIFKENVLISESKKYSIEFQYKYIQQKKKYKIYVYKNDIEIQQYLKSKKVIFFTIEEKKINTVSKLISEELKKLSL